MEKVKTYKLKKLMSDEDGEKLKGQFLDESYMKMAELM